MKEILIIIETRIEITEAEVAQEIHINQIERANIKEPHHHTPEVSII